MADYPDFEGPKCDVILGPEWAAEEGTDKEFAAQEFDVPVDEVITVSYVVPSGKTLYIATLGCVSRGAAFADRDLNQMVEIHLTDLTVPQIKLYTGGNGGAVINSPKPAVIPSGHEAYFVVVNNSNHIVHLFFAASGWEK